MDVNFKFAKKRKGIVLIRIGCKIDIHMLCYMEENAYVIEDCIGSLPLLKRYVFVRCGVDFFIVLHMARELKVEIAIHQKVV